MPFEGQRRWYVVQTYSGYEKAVKNDLERRIDSMGMNDYIFNVLVPEETKTEVTTKADGTEVVKNKVIQIFPGYVFVEMIMTDESWYVVRNTTRVTGLLGSSGQGTKPVPLLQEEMDPILLRAGLRTKPTYQHLLGKTVEIVNGLLKGQKGEVSFVNDEEATITVVIYMFNRATPNENISVFDVKEI
ncbi:MAG: transcription termination/antitermination protein NusG [Acholeplasmataceae bacterium]|jgi:transcriptional antiterminator NusG|nr:transcription termination/antitermination protein NusG [Acholeplasmataceae bacterium]